MAYGQGASLPPLPLGVLAGQHVEVGQGVGVEGGADGPLVLADPEQPAHADLAAVQAFREGLRSLGQHRAGALVAAAGRADGPHRMAAGELHHDQGGVLGGGRAGHADQLQVGADDRAGLVQVASLRALEVVADAVAVVGDGPHHPLQPVHVAAGVPQAGQHAAPAGHELLLPGEVLQQERGGLDLEHAAVQAGLAVDGNAEDAAVVGVGEELQGADLDR